MEILYFHRVDICRRVELASDGAAGPIALSTDQLDFAPKNGARVTIAKELANGSVLEATYAGGVEWESQALVSDPGGNLFSVFSEFGVNPAGGFADTDNAVFSRIRYSSRFDSVELNWKTQRPWFCDTSHGGLTLGFRYFRLSDEFLHDVVVTANDFLNYRVATGNHLAGFQLGYGRDVQLGSCCTLGGHLKSGVYANRADQETRIDATTVGQPVIEAFDQVGLAMLSESGVRFGVRPVEPLQFFVRYDVLFVDGVALAPENLLATHPTLARTPSLNDNGNVLLHGFGVGVELRW